MKSSIELAATLSASSSKISATSASTEISTSIMSAGGTTWAGGDCWLAALAARFFALCLADGLVLFFACGANGLTNKFGGMAGVELSLPSFEDTLAGVGSLAGLGAGLGAGLAGRAGVGRRLVGCGSGHLRVGR